MGHESVSILSPAHRRGSASPSSPNNFSRKSFSFVREGNEKPDLGCKALFYRHQFLLFALAILAFLCSVYLYFAITFTDPCAVLHGTQKSSCQQATSKAKQGFKRRGGRALLSDDFRSILESDGITLGICDPEYINYAPCREDLSSLNLCRKPRERPPLCIIPQPTAYKRKMPDYSAPLFALWLSSVSPSCPFHKLLQSIKERMTLITADKHLKYFNVPGFKSRQIRSALNIGCTLGVQNHLMHNAGILTMHIPGSHDSETCTQEVLDVGFPAMLVTVMQKELPYPNKSYDLILYSGCEIDQRGNHLVELDRILRPGGHFILIRPTYFHCDWVKRQLLSLEKLGWYPISRSKNSAVWKKRPISSAARCPKIGGPIAAYNSLSNYGQHSLLDVIKTSMFSSLKSSMNTDVHGLDTTLNNETEQWSIRVGVYRTLLGGQSFQRLRNIMDMNAQEGSFAAAMAFHPVWVMNVVPTEGSDTLSIVYDRGLVGARHDWCEAFPTYPRTYDLVHASWAVSPLKDKCDTLDVVLEIDRILRPGGWVIFRDSWVSIEEVKSLSTKINWHLFAEYLGDATSFEVVLLYTKLEI